MQVQNIWFPFISCKLISVELNTALYLLTPNLCLRLAILTSFYGLVEFLQENAMVISQSRPSLLSPIYNHSVT